MELSFYHIAIYLLIALIITILFDIQPVSSILWILFPIIIPIRFIIKNNKKRQLDIIEKPLKVKNLPTFDSFVNESENLIKNK